MFWSLFFFKQTFHLLFICTNVWNSLYLEIKVSRPVDGDRPLTMISDYSEFLTQQRWSQRWYLNLWKNILNQKCVLIYSNCITGQKNNITPLKFVVFQPCFLTHESCTLKTIYSIVVRNLFKSKIYITYYRLKWEN